MLLTALLLTEAVFLIRRLSFSHSSVLSLLSSFAGLSFFFSSSVYWCESLIFPQFPPLVAVITVIIG